MIKYIRYCQLCNKKDNIRKDEIIFELKCNFIELKEGEINAN